MTLLNPSDNEIDQITMDSFRDDVGDLYPHFLENIELFNRIHNDKKEC